MLHSSVNLTVFSGHQKFLVDWAHIFYTKITSIALQHSAMLVMCCIVCSIIFTIHVLITVAIQLFEYKSLVKVVPTTKETCCWINGLLWFDHTLYHLSVICQVTSITRYQVTSMAMVDAPSEAW